MGAKRDYYEVLGVGRDASEDDIKKAFRNLAHQFHPDKNHDDGASDKFKEISEAYQVLTDPGKRSAYDRFGHAAVDGQGQAGFGGFGDFGAGGMGSIFEDFYSFFSDANSQAQRGPVRGSDLQQDLHLTFEEAALGAEKEITIRRVELCGTCQGSGAKAGTQPATCTECNGQGRVRRVQQSLFGRFTNVTACPRCRGEGKIVTDPCTACHGTGRESAERQISVSIPVGVDQGTRIQLSGQGDVGERGGPAGNVIVNLHVAPHAFFQRQGADIIFDLRINFAQAALGIDLPVPTLYGEAPLKVPPGSQSGVVFALKGKGVPNFRHAGKGDQLVRLTVATPEKLTKEQKKLFEELAATFEPKKKP
jgi:molecular chaperone DnaJ